LLNVNSKQWVVHHRDHNHANNVDSNFELLCKSCHQKEHDCQSNLPKVQRLSRKGVGNSVPETPGAQDIGQ
jgi:5-methylcytosine-specific restriction endonuclease McrA